MEIWRIAHLWVLGMWAGLVAGESVMEILARRDEAFAAFAARLHLWIDVFVEVPLLLAVVATGYFLLRETPITALLGVKIAFGLFAVGVNLWCTGVVVRRQRVAAGAGAAVMRAESDRIFLAIKLGLPAALIALYLGLRLAHGP
ncbi:MAG: hypothetical protein KC466_13070 [Myxococcales bacterium]|nr:hypothetical protein [Myxococcales bacterium]